MSRFLVFLVSVEAFAIVLLSLTLAYTVEVDKLQAERVKLLEDYKKTCDKYVELANRSSKTETNLRVGYARVVEVVFERLGVTGYIPGANGEILKTMMKEVFNDEQDGNSEEVPEDLRANSSR